MLLQSNNLGHHGTFCIPYSIDDGMAFGETYILTFHAQRKPRLALRIKEVDEYGNYSSPHFKGTVLFYKVSKEVIAKSLEQPLLPQDYQHQDPVCKLALTLPKVCFRS